MVDENICSVCGTKINSSYNFCTNCGTKIRNPFEIENQEEDNRMIKKPKRNTKLLIGLAIGISIISVIAYAWITEIGPEMKRIADIQQKIEENNQRIRQEMASSFQNYDCTYYEDYKVRVCNPTIP